VVEHEVGHEQPDLVCGVAAHRAPAYATSASGLSVAAVRRADAVARLVVAMMPSTSTAPPHAVSVHHSAPEATSAPTTATPSVWPTWRDVVAIAAATPACARGNPETAALVIGALTNPKPMPKIT